MLIPLGNGLPLVILVARVRVWRAIQIRPKELFTSPRYKFWGGRSPAPGQVSGQMASIKKGVSEGCDTAVSFWKNFGISLGPIQVLKFFQKDTAVSQPSLTPFFMDAIW